MYTSQESGLGQILSVGGCIEVYHSKRVFSNPQEN